MNPVEQHIFKQQEPYQSMMLYVRDVLKDTVPEVVEKYSFRLPFYHYKKKSLLYMNVLGGTNYLDVAFLDGAILQKEYHQLKDFNKRKRVRSLQFHSLEDIDEQLLRSVIKAAVRLIDTGNTTKYN
ncbi:DUF1801 domain-containing protein [Urechidicola sp. KH5]